MVIQDALVAVVEPYRLSLYTLPPDGTPPLAVDAEVVRFDDRVTSATVEILGACTPHAECIHPGSCSPAAIHVAVCDLHGLHVFAIPLVLVDGHYLPVHRWSSPYVAIEEEDEPGRFTLSPSFGYGCRSVSYIVDSEQMEDNFKLVTTRLPTGGDSSDDDTSKATSAKLICADMPALYLASVRDFDDTLGLLVVGSGFGELALYSFGGVPLQRLTGCFHPIEFVSEEGSKEVSTVRCCAYRRITCSIYVDTCAS